MCRIKLSPLQSQAWEEQGLAWDSVQGQIIEAMDLVGQTYAQLICDDGSYACALRLDENPLSLTYTGR